MMRAGYAIEYDAIVRHNFGRHLKRKKLKIYIQQDKLMGHRAMKKQQVKDLWRELMLRNSFGREEVILAVQMHILVF